VGGPSGGESQHFPNAYKPVVVHTTEKLFLKIKKIKPSQNKKQHTRNVSKSQSHAGYRQRTEFSQAKIDSHSHRGRASASIRLRKIEKTTKHKTTEQKQTNKQTYLSTVIASARVESTTFLLRSSEKDQEVILAVR
jgi:hypothetical protein